MRILCCTPPIEGLIGPLLPLGQALTAAGAEVLVATGADGIRRVEEAGLRGVVAGPSAMEGAMGAFADPAAAGATAEEQWRFGSAMFASVIAPAKLPALRELIDRWRPDLVVHVPVDLAAAVAAAEAGLPTVSCGTGLVPEQRLVDDLAFRAGPLWSGVAGGLPADGGVFGRLYLDPCPPSLPPAHGASPAVVAPLRPSVPGSRRSVPDHGAAIGAPPGWAAGLAGRPAQPGGASASGLAGRPGQPAQPGQPGWRPLVYVSLGTVPLFNQPATFSRLIADLVRDDIELVLTIGELNDPAALGPQPPNVHVERWLPLAELLPHCDAVVCHGGAGTTLAALACGLPLVLVPQGADQFAMADACGRAGAALVLRSDAADGVAVRDAVRTVLHDGPQRAAARALAAEIAALPSAADVAADLLAFTTASNGGGPNGRGTNSGGSIGSGSVGGSEGGAMVGMGDGGQGLGPLPR